MGNIVIIYSYNYVISLYGDQTHGGDHFEMYRNIQSLYYVTGTNIVLQVNYTSKNKQINKLAEKEIRFVVTRDEEWGQGELDEGSQKVQISSYKINNRDVIHNMINRISTAVYYT